LKITERLPKPKQIAPVYAVVVMLLYGWTISWILWKIPSWLYFLPVTEILGICAYAFTVVFLESLAALLALLVLCLALPKKWFYESFIARASTLVISLFGYLMYFSYSFKSIDTKDYPQTLANWTPAVIVVILLLVYVVGRVKMLSGMVEEFSSRAVVFLYISIPVSVLCLLYIIARNIFLNLING